MITETVTTAVSEAAQTETQTLPAALEVVSEEVSETTSILSDIFTPVIEKLPAIAFAIVFFVVGTLIIRQLLRLLKRALNRSKMDGIMASFMRSIVKIVLYVFLVVIVLSLLGVPMTSIVAVIASAGVTVGLALKDSLSNLAGGFIILFSKPLKEGDTVEVDGITGQVEGISILYTRMVTPDNKTIYIPNGVVAGEKIINYTTKETRRVELHFGIAYDNDIDKARWVLLDVVAKNEEIFADPAPEVLVSAHDESAVTLLLRVWTNNETYWSVYYALLETVKKAFDQNGISIPYPQMDVHLREESFEAHLSDANRA